MGLIFSTVNKLLDVLKHPGGTVAIFLFIWLSIDSLAGKVTLADIKLLSDVVVKAGYDCSVHPLLIIASGAFFVFGVIGITYGMLQRKLRKDTVEFLHGRIRDAEIATDPGRSSSELTPRGESPGES